MHRDMTPDEIKCFKRTQCLFCGQREGFTEGPSASISQNVECPDCGARYNFSLAGIVWEIIREPTRRVVR